MDLFPYFLNGQNCLWFYCHSGILLLQTSDCSSWNKNRTALPNVLFLKVEGFSVRPIHIQLLTYSGVWQKCTVRLHYFRCRVDVCFRVCHATFNLWTEIFLKYLPLRLASRNDIMWYFIIIIIQSVIPEYRERITVQVGTLLALQIPSL
jgi:hypothetical protein